MEQRSSSLKWFANSDALIPKILDYGVFDNGIEWLIYSFIEGELLSQVYDIMSLDNLKEIYYDMGRQLGIIHQHKEVNFWGGMDEDGNDVKGFKTYREYFEDFTDEILADNFKLGYEEFGFINLERLNSKKDLYNLSKGLGICSWAKETAYDYYLQGIKILEETMNR